MVYIFSLIINFIILCLVYLKIIRVKNIQNGVDVRRFLFLLKKSFVEYNVNKYNEKIKALIINIKNLSNEIIVTYSLIIISCFVLYPLVNSLMHSSEVLSFILSILVFISILFKEINKYEMKTVNLYYMLVEMNKLSSIDNYDMISNNKNIEKTNQEIGDNSYLKVLFQMILLFIYMKSMSEFLESHIFSTFHAYLKLFVIFMFLVSVLLILSYKDIIDRFNKKHEFINFEVIFKERIETILVKHFPNKGIRVELEKSGEMNAYAYSGLLQGKHKIVLTTRLIESLHYNYRLDYEDILIFIFGHELGHIKNRDNSIIKMICNYIVITIILIIVSFIIDGMFRMVELSIYNFILFIPIAISLICFFCSLLILYSQKYWKIIYELKADNWSYNNLNVDYKTVELYFEKNKVKEEEIIKLFENQNELYKVFNRYFFPDEHPINEYRLFMLDRYGTKWSFKHYVIVWYQVVTWILLYKGWNGR